MYDKQYAVFGRIW